MSDINLILNADPETIVNITLDSAPVQAVNGKIGFVTLSPQDIGITGLATSGDLLNYVTKTNGEFIDRPTVGGTGILLSGEAARLPDTIVYTTGAQTISGSKTFYADNYIFSGANVIFVQNTGIVSGDWHFLNRPTVNDTGVLLQGELDLSVYATATNLDATGSALESQINNRIINFGDISGIQALTTGEYNSITPISGIVYILI
jgi:hypothetical protein